MQFKANFNLLREWRDAEKLRTLAGDKPCVAIFKRDNKTLVYMCDMHCYNISFNMVDMCFANDFGIKPEILLTEMPNAGFERRFNWHGLQDNTLAHAAAVAAQRNIPIVFADLSDAQMVDVINAGFPDNQITNADLSKILGGHNGPDSKGTLPQQMLAYLDEYGRERFILHNIATALNKYDTVFCIFGIGHYERQRLVLEDMMGAPEYITRIKNMRADFSDLKIEPIKLCDFEMGGTNDENA